MIKCNLAKSNNRVGKIIILLIKILFPRCISLIISITSSLILSFIRASHNPFLGIERGVRNYTGVQAEFVTSQAKADCATVAYANYTLNDRETGIYWLENNKALQNRCLFESRMNK